MANATENNKRIAKNTLLLYVRMLVMMAVTLYTSRVVLAALGVEDFGIYNVVGGVIGMLGFLSGSMTSAMIALAASASVVAPAIVYNAIVSETSRFLSMSLTSALSVD